MPIRGRPVPETSLSDSDLTIIVREYVPRTIRRMCDAMGVRRLDPSARTRGGLRTGRDAAGRATVERYMDGDEFWPVVEWAAIQLARRQDQRRREPEAVVKIIRGLRDIITSARTLETMRARWARSFDPPLDRARQNQVIEAAALDFIRHRKPDRTLRKKHGRNAPAYSWLYR